MNPLRWTLLVIVAASVLLTVAVVLGPGPLLLLLAATAIVLAILQLYAASTDVTAALETHGQLATASSDEPHVSSDIAAVRLQRELAVAGLHELSQEHDLGKLSDADYQVIAGAYRSEARRLVQDEDSALAEARHRAEEYLQRRKPTASSAQATPSSSSTTGRKETPAKLTDAVETSAVHERTECPRCREPNDADARFCKHCGASILSP